MFPVREVSHVPELAGGEGDGIGRLVFADSPVCMLTKLPQMNTAELSSSPVMM